MVITSKQKRNILQDTDLNLELNIRESELEAEVEKVSEPGNVVPRNFFGLKFSQKVFKKLLRLEENF